MATNQLSIGSLVYYTAIPIALYMKTNDAKNLWKVGMIIDYVDNYQCIILDKDGQEKKCWTTMLRQMDL